MSLVVIAETVRRHLTSTFFLLYAMFAVAMAFIMGRYQSTPGGWHGLMALLVYITGAQLIGPEFSSGTLQLILARPINRSTYLLSRYTGVITSIWLFVAVGFAAEIVGRLSGGKSIEWWSVVPSLNVGVEAMLTCALLVLFGTFLRSYMNVALYVLLNITLTVAVSAINQLKSGMPGLIGALARFFERHPEIGAAISWIERNVYPDRPPAFDRSWLMLILSNSALALLIACLIFRRREVPYGAD